MCDKENEIKFHYVQNSACLATIVYDDITTGQGFVMAISMDVRHASYEVSAIKEVECTQSCWLLGQKWYSHSCTSVQIATALVQY